MYCPRLVCQGKGVGENHLLKSIVWVGVASYSFYLWHQLVLAFYRYVVEDSFGVVDYLLVLLICAFVGCVSYLAMEKPLGNYFSCKRKEWICVALCSVVAILLIACSAYVYSRHGIVRDVPELELYVDSKENLESQDYNERNMAFDKEFPKNGEKNVLVVGDSFARDFINILRESGVDTVMNISLHKETDEVLRQRIYHADFVFVANNVPFDCYYPYMKQMLTRKFYRVGTKSFSTRNGIVYNNDRYGSEYWEQSFLLSDSQQKLIDKERQLFGDNYIDMMKPIVNSDGTYPYFTPDRYFYSHDGIHLTQAGAKEYAKRLNVRGFFKE